MNGPGHYAKAESLLEEVDRTPHRVEDVALTFARGQVHATLALAGANVGQDEREASRLLRYQRDAAVTEINTLRRAVQRGTCDCPTARTAKPRARA